MTAPVPKFSSEGNHFNFEIVQILEHHTLWNILRTCHVSCASPLKRWHNDGDVESLYQNAEMLYTYAIADGSLLQTHTRAPCLEPDAVILPISRPPQKSLIKGSRLFRIADIQDNMIQSHRPEYRLVLH